MTAPLGGGLRRRAARPIVRQLLVSNEASDYHLNRVDEAKSRGSTRGDAGVAYSALKIG